MTSIRVAASWTCERSQFAGATLVDCDNDGFGVGPDRLFCSTLLVCVRVEVDAGTSVRMEASYRLTCS